MLLEIDPRSGVPIYRQIIEQVRQQVLLGELAEGDQLPTVRSLAPQLKVNPMTVSKAYSLRPTARQPFDEVEKTLSRHAITVRFPKPAIGTLIFFSLSI